MRTGSRTLATAKRLRQEMTRPEIDLWFRLKTTDTGLRFRRQHPLGPYVLDFYCPAARLAIEVDGFAHNMGDAPARDARRDAWLRAQGLTVLRIPAIEVIANPDEVADGVFRHAMALASPPPSRR